MSRPRSNRAMLLEFLGEDCVRAAMPKGKAKIETSHMHCMAAKRAADFEALSRGEGECLKHRGQVRVACPICRGIWPEAATP